ncbi:MAG: DNA-protecting protein DprA [Sphingobacteriales bacterium]|nr:DNA-protecting protein DprA [Sphingobacteriales bacterium]
MAQKNGVTCLGFTEPDYPARLKNCYDAPILLYFSGKTPAALHQPRAISIVGTRLASAYGKAVCEALVAALAPYNPLIVSGLALGIDAAAHKSALQHQLNTIGVLGHGLDEVYPREHKTLAQKIQQQGGLLTEFMTKTLPDKTNFPRRNRIIAGLTEATLLIETANKGGSIITAQLARSYHREVMAVPGRVGDVYSSGCNMLIKANIASLIENAKDVVAILNWPENPNAPTQPTKQALLFDLMPNEQTVMVALRNENPQHIDKLVQTTQMPLQTLSGILLNLELNGLIRTLPGSRYEPV